ncbi:hypothetical protein EVAR_84625_1 [Eumeta japonica]|uniref:Uncharacterized protein n=1 Tax=Eumeta variegata TaxID=151549 RepID=A0A4C1UYE6_EUMVA|nr:hypothetical protein EVAR_84625_1 [Eumeta japonica]
MLPNNYVRPSRSRASSWASHTKNCLDIHSSPLPTLEPAPKKADQRSSLNTDTPRSPSVEPYTESTDSMTYGVLTVEADEGGEDYFSSHHSISN